MFPYKDQETYISVGLDLLGVQALEGSLAQYRYEDVHDDW